MNVLQLAEADVAVSDVCFHLAQKPLHHSTSQRPPNDQSETGFVCRPILVGTASVLGIVLHFSKCSWSCAVFDDKKLEEPSVQ